MQGAPTPDHGGLLVQHRHHSFCSAIGHLACSWLAISKDQMEMLERDHDFQCSGFCVCFKDFFQVNGVAGFGGLNYYFNYLV
jgi:hypothetical protein